MIDWKKYEGQREVVASPEKFSEKRFEIQTLLQAAQKSEILYRGWPFINFDTEKTRVVGDSIATITDLTEAKQHEYIEMWRLKQSGLFLHRAVMNEDTYGPWVRRGKILGLENTVYHVSEAIGSLWHLYRELAIPDNEKITITFIYRGVQERTLEVLSQSRMPFMGKRICIIPEITVRRSLLLEEWRTSPVDISSEICAELFLQFQWTDPNMASLRQLASKLLAKG